MDRYVGYARSISMFSEKVSWGFALRLFAEMKIGKERAIGDGLSFLAAQSVFSFAL
jgi:hypothetical protein